MRWLVAGAFLPTPSGRRFPLTEDFFTGQLGSAASRLRLTVQDRIGSGDASSYEVSFERLGAFHLSEVVNSVPDLRTLRPLLEVLSGARMPSVEEAARLEDLLSTGRLSSAMAQALRGSRSPEDARRIARAALEEALFATARDLLHHPVVTRLESTWRGLHWLREHCPASAGMDIEVLDVEPASLVETLAQCLDVPPLQRPDACFILDASEDIDTLHQLAALGEQASLPMVAAVPFSLLGEGQQPASEQEARSREAWKQLRSDEASRWLCAALNPVVMLAEHQGEIRRQCFTSPALAVAALLSASFRDTRTFGRLVGPGSGTRSPAVWQPHAGSTVSTEAGLSLREQERLAAQGLLAVSGWWDSNTVMLAAAPTVYGGRDATRLPGQLLTGRLVRLAQELAERLPTGASPDAVAAAFSRAAEAFLPTGSGQDCQLHARVVSTGNGERGVQVRASLRPELAGAHVQLAFTLPLPR
ncbi:type VI secretion system contractile sheath domain-containing protein [Hyalangium sp.]|uniref:type VI secretion system contractile sheath domain-containing protein n=1 Tax=Hyalangium sp. TaxID=2028555 RepID=UPI002D28CD2C|nr:type VI secretion system contractile sheath large subunit [Hyalangium sp.]HYI00980.1 type VI secretion system contractile sheath large subunit [Hyalangium sp.]